MIKSYSDATLMSLTKAELIEHLRCAEHNRDVIEQRLEQHIENVKDWQPVKHGHWNLQGRKLCCSSCEHRVYIGTDDDSLLIEESLKFKFCPNCGSKMG